jgi:hypothetical protein
VELPQIPAPRCIHLMSKTMATHGEGYATDPEPRDELTDCWCIRSGRALGPDNDGVSLQACSNPERDCYQEY